MNILAIDPGPEHSGYVLIDAETLEVKSSGSCTNNETIIQFLRDGYIDVNGKGIHGFHVVACEMIASYGMAVGQEVFNTCVQIGRFIQAYKMLLNAGDVILVKRQEAKMHLCHSPKAKDANVMQALKDKLGEVGTKKNPGPLYGISKHAWAALAVGVYAAETQL